MFIILVIVTRVLVLDFLATLGNFFNEEENNYNFGCLKKFGTVIFVYFL